MELQTFWMNTNSFSGQNQQRIQVHSHLNENEIDFFLSNFSVGFSFMHLNCSSLPALDPVGQSDHTWQMGTVITTSFVNTSRVTRKGLKWYFMDPRNVIPGDFLLWLLRVGWPLKKKKINKRESHSYLCNRCHQTVPIKYRCLYSQSMEHFQTEQHFHMHGRKEEARSGTSLCLVPLVWRSEFSVTTAWRVKSDGLCTPARPITTVFSPLLDGDLLLGKRNELPRILSCCVGGTVTH